MPVAPRELGQCGTIYEELLAVGFIEAAYQVYVTERMKLKAESDPRPDKA